MTIPDKVASSQAENFRGLGCFSFVTLRKQLAENATKSYQVYIVPHIHNKVLGIRLARYSANKN